MRRDGGRRDLRRVLVVDDEPSLRLVVRLNLTLGGYDVVEAADGESGYQRARGEPFDVFLLDVMMPPTSGYELAERLRSDPATRDVPIVFLSARADRSDIDRGRELGALDYITKPFDPLLLAARLDALLDGKETVDGR
ncbi:MAG: response regulator [Gaiellaceae bacterium]